MGMMGTRAHTGRTYLNSCITVPIDPCNNCPAPIYNRPKTYMGKQTSTTTATNKQPCHNKGKARTKADTETGQTWTNNTGIRSLAKFYDSIPGEIFRFTVHDPTPQFDWEVRKTPAWKSLSLNESHKALLSIRLASRKAEQALQEREYELHMEMMRQRVKSAPLLLEGPTYWGPEVGKLTHTCRSEGLQHACLSNQQRSKQRSSKKKCGASTNRSSRCPTVANDGANSNKFQQLRKIYGSGSTVKSCSRQSHRSSKASCRHEPDMHDSADELCSVDRAFL